MNMISCQQIIDNYIHWIRDNTFIKSIKNGSLNEVTSPFLDRHNDHIQIYISKKGDDYILTDAGNTIQDLEISGMTFSSPKRDKLMKTVLNGFGVKLGDSNDLFIEANVNNIGQKKHYLIQAIISVNDMFVLSAESVYSFFKEDVELYFRSNDIFFTKDVKLAGKTGFDHNIDFIISASKIKPERLIKTTNTLRRDSIMAAIFGFNDIKEVREQKTQNYVIYNDTENKNVLSEVLNALSIYSVKTVPWSERESFKNEFMFN